MPAAASAPLRLVLLATAALLSASTASAQRPSAVWFSGYSMYGMSNDGRVAVGESVDYRPLRWTPTGGFADLGGLTPNHDMGTAWDASGDGSVVVGRSSDGSPKPFRWTQATGMTPLSTSSGEAEGVSDDGRFAVGSISIPGGRVATLWTPEGERVLGKFDETPGSSWAYAVSADGSYVAGRSIASDGKWRAFRWSEQEGLRDLGTLQTGSSNLQGISADGQVLVGHSDWNGRFHAVVWTEAGGLEDLGTFQANGNSNAYDVSDDGAVIVGNNDLYGGTACVWTDREPRALIDILRNDYGVSMTGWSSMHSLYACSGDGTKMVGAGYYQSQATAFVVTLPLPPQIEAEIAQGGVIETKVGRTIELPFTATDPGGDALTLYQSGLPASAALTPATGIAPGSSIEGKLTWTPTSAEIGVEQDVHLYVRDVETRRASLRFTLKARANQPPEVDAPLAVVIECAGGENRAELQTLVDDPDGDELTATWKVNGQIEKTETLAAGSLASFDFAYPHGENVVLVEVSDGDASVGEQTTVTVQDTTSPLVVVAPSVELAVERGELFANSSRLVPPQVHDACDEEPTVTHDAPATLPVGTSTVTWTVLDANGNSATASQSVVVVNAAPVAHAGADIRKTTAAKRISVRLNGRKSYDPDRHDLRYSWRAPGVRFDDPKSARPRGDFPIGATVATLTVIDEGGRRAVDTVRVIVRKKVSRRESAAAARVFAASASELSCESLSKTPVVPSLAEGIREAVAAQSLSEYPEWADEDRATYGDVRARQAAHSLRAAALLYDSYLAGADDTALLAGVDAYRSMLHAHADADAAE